MPADFQREVQLAALLEQARAARDRGEPAGAADLHTPPPLREELDGLLSAVRSLDRAAADWRDAISAGDTVAMSASPDEQTGTIAAPSGAPADPTVVTRVGRYQILRPIGAGGMGEVFEAFDPELGRRVALKLPFLGPGREGLRQRFLREARAAAGVRHPNVCPVYDAGEYGGRPFVVMAFVEGESLAQRLSGGRYEDVREAVALVAKVTEGLAAVHAAGIIHRDLKPGNILIDAAGNPLLTDFGLARPTESGEHLTADGATLGTPAYMSPEQANPSLGPTTIQTDIYSLGVTMYQMLTGRLPFTGSVAQQLVRLATGPIIPAPSVARPGLDPRLDAIVLNATARSAADRYPDAARVAADLNDWLGSRATPAAVAAVKPSSRPTRKSWLAPVAVGVLVLVGGLALWAAMREPDGQSKNPNPNDKQPDPKKEQAKPDEGLTPMNPAALVQKPATIQGLASWNIECDGRVDIPTGVHFLGGNKLRFQFGTAGERDHDLGTGGSTEPKVAGHVAAVSPDRMHWVIQEGKDVLAYYRIDDDTPRVRFRELRAGSMCSISPDGTTLAVASPGSAEPTISTWSLKTGERNWEKPSGFPRKSESGPMSLPLWLDGGRAIGTVVAPGTGLEPVLVVLGAADGKPDDSFPVSRVALSAWPQIGCVASADGSRVAAFGLDADRRPTVSVWQVKPRKQLLKFTADGPQPGAPVDTARVLPFAAFSGDGKRLAFAGGGAVRVWELGSDEPLRTIETPGEGSGVTTGLSADGKVLIVRQKRVVRFINVDDGTLRFSLVLTPRGHKQDQWLAISPEGHYKAASKEVEAKVRFTAREDGKDMVREYTPAEFATKFGWKNDPAKVKLLCE